MNIQALRFLLHGSPEHYNSTEPLFVTPESNSVWSKVASHIFEPWRIIPQNLAEKILKDERENLGIRSTSPKELITSLASLDPSVLNGQNFTREERQEILKQVSLYGGKELWKQLPLHTADDGTIVSVTTNTYKCNPDFEIPFRLGSLVNIISETNGPDWIPLWTPRAAIILVLRQAQPDQYDDLLLKLIPQVNDLKLNGELSIHLKNTPWLQLKTGQPIAPENVILLSSGLADLTSALEQVFQSEKNCSYANSSMLAEKLQNLPALEIVCQTWYDNDILEFFLEETQDPSAYVCIILKILKSLERRKQTIRRTGKSIINLLQIKKWLVDKTGRPRSPLEIIHFPSIDGEATEILRQQASLEYITPAMLRDDLNIQFCLESDQLKVLFLSGEDAIEQLGNAIANLPEYYLGYITESNLSLNKLAKILEGCAHTPALILKQKISPEEFEIFILPQIQQPIENDERLQKILNWLAEKHPIPSSDAVDVYNFFLQSAYSIETFKRQVLPHIQLLNQQLEWRSSSLLCDGERYTGIDKASVLHSDQRNLLSIYLEVDNSRNLLELASVVSKTIQPESTSVNIQELEQYFRPWLSHLPSEAIGGLLCLFAGTNQDIQNLAKKYLQRRSLDNLRERLLWSDDLRKRNFKLSVKAIENTMQKVCNLLGDDIDVLLQQGKVADHIFVGQLDRSTQEIVLLKFDLPEDNRILSEILINSAKVLIQRIHKTETESIEEVWKDLLNSQQLYVGSARNYILNYLPMILRMLNIQNQSIRNCLDLMGKLESELEELKLRCDVRVNDREKRISNDLKETRKELARIVGNSSEGAQAVLQAVRRKIEHGQYGYDISSVPFELFQNADDALIELEGLLKRTMPERNHFVCSWQDFCLTVMHWGRPINMVTHPDVQDKDPEPSGFERDLVKMLSFSDSSKGDDETGKFGLGFKTVHMVSKQPYVISDELKFTICAGLIPSTLPRPAQENEDEKLTNKLQEYLKEYSPSPGIKDGTVIYLPLDLEILESARPIVDSFCNSIGILLAFSKRIKRCTLLNESGKPEILSWSPQPVLGIAEIEFGQIKLPDPEHKSVWRLHNLLNFRLSSGNVAFVIPPNLSDKSPLSSLPTFWVTNPTKESLNIRFIVNGHFDITTGRTSLDRDSKRNQELICKIGAELGEVLVDLFRYSEGNWSALRQFLNLNQEVSAYQFWEFLWNILVKDWLKLNSEDTTFRLLRTGFATEYFGFGYLISYCSALPNELFGSARCLVRPDQITHKVKGLLAKQEIFNVVSGWPKFKTYCSPSQWIHDQVWQDVLKVMGTASQQPGSLRLADILSMELDDRKVDPEMANNIGQLFNDSRMKEWKISHLSEYKDIDAVLNGRSILFMNQEEKYLLPASSLLLYQPDDPEEKRLVGFAPPKQILHLDYSDEGLEFFRVCRPRRETIVIKKLVEWARSATTEEQRQAVRVYLSSGERSLEFAGELRNSIENTWMGNDPAIRSLLQTKARQAEEERAIQGEIRWEQISSLDNSQASQDLGDSPEEPNPNDSKVLLDDIYRWWEEQGYREIRDYNQRLYPIGIDELTQGLRDGDRSAWLMLFFLGATHTMGRTKYEQHRDFIRFCMSPGWWETFSTADPRDTSEQWIDVLNDYLESLRQDTTWYYWMEKYPNIYQFSKYLDEYRESFLRAERIHRHFALTTLTNPRLAPDLSGGGVDAPPLRIGIGANFVIRELVRFEIIEPTEYILPHCFVPKAKIRRVMMRLGCQGLQSSDSRHSHRIYTFLQKEFERLGLSDLPTFQNCFDIPVELYAKRHSLDLRGLLVRDDLGWYERLSDDDYFEDEASGN